MPMTESKFTRQTALNSATTCQKLPHESARACAPIPIRVPSSEVARILGVKRQTLSKWRMKKRGPKGFLLLSPTRGVYKLSEVEAYIRELEARLPAFNLFRPSPTRLRGVA